MIRKIAANQLQPGMFVVDLHCRWLASSFWRTRFLVEDEGVVARIRADGVNEVSIDTERGFDLPVNAAT